MFWIEVSFYKKKWRWNVKSKSLEGERGENEKNRKVNLKQKKRRRSYFPSSSFLDLLLSFYLLLLPFYTSFYHK
jgi:hypothetical protein